MKVNLSVESHGITYNITGEPSEGDFSTYHEIANMMGNLLSSVYGYTIYLDAHTEPIKAGLNNDDQDVDFDKP